MLRLMRSKHLVKEWYLWDRTSCGSQVYHATWFFSFLFSFISLFGRIKCEGQYSKYGLRHDLLGPAWSVPAVICGGQCPSFCFVSWWREVPEGVHSFAEWCRLACQPSLAAPEASFRLSLGDVGKSNGKTANIGRGSDGVLMLKRLCLYKTSSF